MKKTIRDFDLKDKKVIIRVDFNVPIKDGVITDDNRIKQSLETINYAIDKGAKVILMSHLGRIKTSDDLKNNSLCLVSVRLSQLLNKNVIFVGETKGEKLESLINNMHSGDVLLMENTRYEDLNGKKESSNDEKLGKYWASLGDIFINDAFGTTHRAHASNVGIASNLPNGIGFLIEKELQKIDEQIKNPKRPFIVILGGAKVSDKIGVIKNLVNIADYILIGGGMAFTFLKASGIEIGASLLDEENISFCEEILDKYLDKIVLPIDVVTATSLSDTKARTCFINEIKPNEMGLDIGPQTVDLFKQYLSDAKTVVWNGTLGATEYKLFEKGTKDICEILESTSANVIVGGGDTAGAVIKMGYENKFYHISTGGGASLALLENSDLPGISVIDEKE